MGGARQRLDRGHLGVRTHDRDRGTVPLLTPAATRTPTRSRGSGRGLGVFDVFGVFGALVCDFVRALRGVLGGLFFPLLAVLLGAHAAFDELPTFL